MTTLHELASPEWAELAGVGTVRAKFSLAESEHGEALCKRAVGVRFQYLSQDGGYCGPLYVLRLARDPEVPPIILVRQGHQLAAANADTLGAVWTLLGEDLSKKV